MTAGPEMLQPSQAPLSSTLGWDSPALSDYVEKERALEQVYSDDELELEQELLALWARARGEHPELCGSFTRSACMLRDFGRDDEAASVLREGIQWGHDNLKKELVRNFPDLLDEDELVDAAQHDDLRELAVRAMLSQRKYQLVAETLASSLKSAADSPDQLALVTIHLPQLIALLVQVGLSDEARQSHAELQAALPAEYAHLSTMQILGELIEADSFADEATLSQLIYFHATGAQTYLQSSLIHLTRGEQLHLLKKLQRRCPVFWNAHAGPLEQTTRDLRVMRTQLALAWVAALALAGTTVGYILNS